MKTEFLNAMNFRHACKIFDSTKKISSDDFNYILEVGRLSPSSFGLEPWKFLVVQNSEKREKLKEYTWGAQNQLPTCSHFLVVLARKSYFTKYNTRYVESIIKDIQKAPNDIYELKTQFLKNFQENDFSLLKNEEKISDWAMKQTYIASANMMTGAAMIGIDSCPMEGFNVDKINNILKDDFGVDTEKFTVSLMLAFGYRINPQPIKTRQNIDDIVEWH